MSPFSNRFPSRRRFLQIIAATTMSGLASVRANALAAGGVQAWEGEALGADASITLAGLDPLSADEILRACRDEIGRLESVFSLYQQTSALSRLNAAGFLADPPAELIYLLDTCRQIFAVSNGGFDPTIQPLWQLYAETYGDVRSPRAPEASEVAARRGLIGLSAVSWSRRHVRFARAGMAMTLNGIAQGAITDRVTVLLRESGVAHALVNVGEHAGIGHHPDGRAWQVGIQDPRTADAVVDIVELVNQSVATSGAYGGRFGDSGLSHIIDPRTGRSPDSYLSVSVRHASAALADGLSTAFSLMSESEIATAAARIDDVTVLLVRADGTLVRF